MIVFTVNEHKNICIAGLNRQAGYATDCDLSLLVLQSHSRQLLDILELFQMKQVIADATRITSNTASLLDIIATNRPDKVKESGVVHVGISDHSLVYVCLKISLPRDINLR